MFWNTQLCDRLQLSEFLETWVQDSPNMPNQTFCCDDFGNDYLCDFLKQSGLVGRVQKAVPVI